MADLSDVLMGFGGALIDNGDGTYSLRMTISGETVDLDVEGPAAHGAAVTGNPMQMGYEAADYDGSALPNDVDEGDVVRPKASLYGVPYAMLVSEDGSDLGQVNVNDISKGTQTNDIKVTLDGEDIELTAGTGNSVAAYAASLVVKASAGTCYSVDGFNSGSAQFIQLHDAASLPSDSAVPEDILYVGANSNFSFKFGERGKAFSTGIVVCNSSTGPTKTIGSADCWFSAVYS